MKSLISRSETFFTLAIPCLCDIRRFIASAGTYANLVKQAKSKQKIIDKMEAAGLIEKVEIPKPLNFRFENIRRLPPPILAFNEVAFSYSGKKQDYLYKNLSFGIEYVSCFGCTTQAHGLIHSMDSRIAILGANGAGKSTLLNLITSVLQPVEGTISKHANLKLSKYSQHSADQLPYESSPLEYFQRLFFERFPEKDIQVHFLACDLRFVTDALPGMAGTTWPFRSFGFPSDIAHPTSLRWSTQPVIPWNPMISDKS
jgi:ATP-binding cassette, subfamily F, member 2